MKQKLFFLMLTLFVLSVASVNAQVRIGGTDTPHTSAVLDLNADNAVKAGSLGLALPRVELETNLDELNGTEPVPGTIVYNSAETLEGEGVYVWTKQWGSAGGPVPVSAVFITNSRINPTTTAGATFRLSAVVFPANATNQNLRWSIKSQTPISGTGDVATIDPLTGVIYGIQGGDLVAQVEALGGSDVLDEIAVAVSGPAGSISGLSGTVYDLYYFGETIGTWMITDLREGTPTSTGTAPGTPQAPTCIVEISGQAAYYYGVEARNSNCPDSFRIPTLAELLNVLGSLNSASLPAWMGETQIPGYIAMDSGGLAGGSYLAWGAGSGYVTYGVADKNITGQASDRGTHVRCVKL
jgi:hypothetical protein